MAKVDQRWEELHQLATFVRDIELAKLSGLNLDISERKSAISELRVRRRNGSAQVRDVSNPDAAQVSGADLRWLDWLKGEIRSQNSEVARKIAEFELQAVRARKAFGRAQVVKSISEKLSKR